MAFQATILKNKGATVSLSYTMCTDRPPQLGMIVLQADETLERDMRQILPPHVELLVSRVPSAPTVCARTLRAMEAVLSEAAGRLPGGARFQAVGYGCTSGTAEIGADRIAELIRAGVETPEVSDPLTALIRACRHLKIKRLGLISPYVASVSNTLRHALETAGISVTAFDSFDEPDEAKVVRIAAPSIHAAATAMARSSTCDALFLSCTNLRTLDVIDAVERETGLPVLSSNQVLAWDLLHRMDRLEGARGVGKLFDTGA